MGFSISFCQLSGRKSLRDVVEDLKAKGHKLYHLGMKKVSPILPKNKNPGSFSATGVQFLERETGFERMK